MIKFNENDTFLITGANSGIGKAIALSLNRLGATVIAVARNQQRLDQLKEESADRNNIHLEVKDLVKDLAQLSQWVYELRNKYSKLKGLILSAGEQQIIPLKALTVLKAKELFDLNYFSNLELCKGFSDPRVNTGKGSSILFISSIASITGNAGIINYSASKGAVNSAVKSMAKELSRYGIRVNALLCGLVMTELLEKKGDVYTPEFIDKVKSEYPLGIGKPEDIANLATFLVSEEAGWITGSNIVIDGGGSL